jgi:predicted  nucleic acid-binding Zn-ribbon protein
VHNLKKIANALRGLNALEAKPEAGWVKELSPGEKKLAAERFREILPTALLKHHDSRIALGKRSLAIVQNGICGACHLQLPSGHRRRKAAADDLDVCDNCGVFLEWPVPEVSSPAGKAAGKKARDTKTASHR